MGRRIRYKDYIIKSNPEPVPATGRWKLNVIIFWNTNGALTMRPFSATSLYETEEEADVHGITYGQRIIDGKVPGLSVNSH